MKKIMATVGLAALGAATVQSVNAQSSLGADGAKAWTVSASLRGFYDDNLNTAPTKKTDTFGLEVEPSVAMALAWGDQTKVDFAYTFTYKYYDKEINPNTGDHDDMTHTVAAHLSHSFTERTTLAVSDSFVIGQEPDALRTVSYATVQRIPGNNIRNYATISANHQLTRELGLEVGYENGFFDYQDEGGTALNPSRSGALDRLEHSAHIEGRWTVQPNTVALAGYQYSFTDYTGDEPVDFAIINNSLFILRSSGRNYRTHYGYAGVEHTFRPDLTGSLRAGASFSENYNAPSRDTHTAPYISGSMNYRYAKDSSAEVGISHDLSATDQISLDSKGSITANQERTLGYVKVAHAIFPDLIGTVSGTIQYGTFNGGTLDGMSEILYLLGVNLEYRINRHISATVSYNYDKLDSDTGRSFDRNRVYLGTTVTY